MNAYANETTVSVERTRAEIEATLSRYGANRFAYIMGEAEAVIGFSAHSKFVKFTLPIPSHNDPVFRVTPSRKNIRTQEDAYKAWEQACRSRWRSLLRSGYARQNGICLWNEEAQE